MNIVLIGMPGSGKSTLGRLLAHQLNYYFVDLDEQIELEEKQPITSIFEKKGEQYFRQCEKKALEQQLEKTNMVISSGGGTPCFFNNMALINQKAWSIYLKVSPAELLIRLKSSRPEQRPMIKGKTEEDLQQFIKQKLNEREPFYLLAYSILQKDNIQLEDIMKIIPAKI